MQERKKETSKKQNKPGIKQSCKKKQTPYHKN